MNSQRRAASVKPEPTQALIAVPKWLVVSAVGVFAVLCGVVGWFLIDAILEAREADDSLAASTQKVAQGDAVQHEQLKAALVAHLSKSKTTREILTDLTVDPKVRAGLVAFGGGEYAAGLQVLLPDARAGRGESIAAIVAMRDELQWRLGTQTLVGEEKANAEAFLIETAGFEPAIAPHFDYVPAPHRPQEDERKDEP
jgi:hypothetical protein